MLIVDGASEFTSEYTLLGWVEGTLLMTHPGIPEKFWKNYLKVAHNGVVSPVTEAQVPAWFAPLRSEDYAVGSAADRYRGRMIEMFDDEYVSAINYPPSWPRRYRTGSRHLPSRCLNHSLAVESLT